MKNKNNFSERKVTIVKIISIKNTDILKVNLKLLLITDILIYSIMAMSVP